MIDALLFLAVLAVLGLTFIYAIWGDQFEIAVHKWFERSGAVRAAEARPTRPPRSNVTLRRRPYDQERDEQ